MISPSSKDTSGFIRIVSTYHITDTSAGSLPSLEPNAYYLLYCADGKGRIPLGREDGTLLFSPNSLSLFYSKEVLCLIPESETFSFYLFKLSEGAISSYHTLFGNRIFLLSDFPQSQSVLPLFQTLQRLFHHTETTLPLISNKLLTDLFTELFFWQQKDDCFLPGAPSHVADLKDWCDTHFAEHFSLDELAESFRVSKYKLCRDFSAYFEISPLQYLNQQRIEYAKKLLLTTNDRIYEIGNAVGIENTNHFINLFKKNTGTTPNEFRHSHSFF